MTHADSIWLKALELHSDSLQSRVDALQARLDALQAKSDLVYSVVESSNSGVSNQLSTVTIWLEIIAIVITIGGVFLGFYISKKRREIEKMAKTVDEKKEIVETLAQTVDEKAEKVDAISETTKELDKKIHNDLTGLYKQLHQEETKSLLERLILEPLDISNIIRLLLARDMVNDYFFLLRKAYLNFLEIVKSDRDENRNAENDYYVDGSYYEPNFDYTALFFQHYFEQSIKDDVIRPYMMAQLIEIINGAFKRDMLKSTECLCNALSDKTATFDKLYVLVDFLSSLNNTKHRDFTDLKVLLEMKIDPDLLNKSKEICKEQNHYLALFGIQPPKTDDSEKEK